MGWTSFYDVETLREQGVYGDEERDLAEDFVAALNDIYLKKWRRKPTEEEIIQTMLFVVGGDEDD